MVSLAAWPRRRVNGDGIDDVIVGAWDYGQGSVVGGAYVVFGSEQGFGATVDVSALDGSDGFSIANSDLTDGQFGTGSSVAGAGDVNGDGIDDLIVSDRDNDLGFGSAHVVFGSRDGFDATLDISSSTARTASTSRMWCASRPASARRHERRQHR
ncbi:MAG: integrin alpha [Amaricoccus sp.]